MIGTAVFGGMIAVMFLSLEIVQILAERVGVERVGKSANDRLVAARNLCAIENQDQLGPGYARGGAED